MYNYLHRWWRIMLAGMAIGAVAGLGFYYSQAHPIDYPGTAKITIAGPLWHLDKAPSTVALALGTGQWA